MMKFKLGCYTRRPSFGVLLHRARTRAPFALSSPHEHTQNAHAGKSAAAEPPPQPRALLRSLHRPTVALGGLPMPCSCSRTKPESNRAPDSRVRPSPAKPRHGNAVSGDLRRRPCAQLTRAA